MPERCTTDGFARGLATLAGFDADRGRTFTLSFQNEFLCLEDGDGRLIALPADPQWRSCEGLKLAGPGSFGYDHAFVPIEDLKGQSPSVAKEMIAREGY